MNIALWIVHIGQIGDRPVLVAALLQQSVCVIILTNCANLKPKASANTKGYLARRFAFLAAFRCAFEYFFIAFCCFLEAFFSLLFCCLADFLSNSFELLTYSATPGLCALAGIDQATPNAASSMKTATRFMLNFFLAPKNSTSLHPPVPFAKS
jgi:hypothetical protein